MRSDSCGGSVTIHGFVKRQPLQEVAGGSKWRVEADGRIVEALNLGEVFSTLLRTLTLQLAFEVEVVGREQCGGHCRETADEMTRVVATDAFLAKIGFNVPSGVASMACSQQQKPVKCIAWSGVWELVCQLQVERGKSLGSLYRVVAHAGPGCRGIRKPS